MKPIVVAELAGSAGYGGGERYVELLLDRLDPTRFHPLLICPEPGPFVSTMASKHIPTSMIHLSPLFNPIALLRLAHFLRQNHVTLLHTHGARSNVYGRLAAWLADVPCIVGTVHNSIRDYEIGPVKRFIYNTILRILLPTMDRLICVSDAIKYDVISDCPGTANTATTVRNGIDLRRFSGAEGRQKIRREWCVGDGPALLTVARLTEQKGHRFLIEALPGLLTEWPSLTCLFVGEGDGREPLRSLARERGVEHACRFAGAQQNVADWYAAADVVVLPSLSEGLPFVVLEALAMSRPVVASRVNGVPEIIEDGRNGLLVPPRDTPALETAIRKLLHAPVLAARLAMAGQQDVSMQFSVGKMIEDTVRVFEDALPALRMASTGAPPEVRQKAA